MVNNIVNVLVTQTVAPLPSTLQQSGAFISQGGTSLAAGSLSFLTQLSDLTAILAAPRTISTLAWSSGVVTVTTAVPHGFTNGKVFPLTIAGAVPSGYNGTFSVTVTGVSTLTYSLAVNPGAETTPGTYMSGSVNELTAMATTFFGQGSSVGVYVVELGEGSVADGVTALTTFIANNPATVYSYLTPRNWDSDNSFLAFLAGFESTTAKTYFYVTTTDANRTNYTVLMKDVFTLIEAPSVVIQTAVVQSTEFSLAAVFWNTLHAHPSATNKVPPLAFTFVFGVTPYPTIGNGAKLSAWKTQGVNWIGTGSEGGITNTIVFWGTMMDTRPWNYWYSVDWLQINVDLFLANAVINGSNDPINPLYLNQDGINRLQAVGASVLSSAITFGLALGTVVQSELDSVSFTSALENGKFAGQAVINAIPFTAYYTANPSDFRIGVYNGFSVTYTPLRGFVSITVNINVTDFVAA